MNQSVTDAKTSACRSSPFDIRHRPASCQGARLSAWGEAFQIEKESEQVTLFPLKTEHATQSIAILAFALVTFPLPPFAR